MEAAPVKGSLESTGLRHGQAPGSEDFLGAQSGTE